MAGAAVAAGGLAGGAGRAVEPLLELADQIFEIVDLARQFGGARPLGLERLLALGLLLSAAPRSARSCACARRRARRPRAFSRSRSAAISLRTRSSSARSLASASASCRISGSTAPSSMAVRTDCSASSGLTISAGGGRWPMRCSAASTSPITARRPSSDLRMLRSLSSSGLSRASVAGDLGFDAAHAAGGVDQVLVELAPVGADAVRSRA